MDGRDLDRVKLGEVVGKRLGGLPLDVKVDLPVEDLAGRRGDLLPIATGRFRLRVETVGQTGDDVDVPQIDLEEVEEVLTARARNKRERKGSENGKREG